MGALGLMYANIIQEHLGSQAVQFVMDGERIEKYKNTDFKINGVSKKFRMVDAKNAMPADFVLVAVKFTGLEKALETIKKCVGPDTVIISVLNGISSEEVLAKHFGREKIVYSVAQAMDSMRFGSEVRYTKEGELRIGVANGGVQEKLKSLEDFFDKSGIHYIEEKDILRQLWNKFMLNVGINQTCMVFSACYSQVLGTKELKDVFVGAMQEVKAVANKKGINLNDDDINQWIKIIATFAPNGTPSMGQDRIAKRKSEVELFSGTVIRLGKETDTPVPINQMLYEKIMEIEAEY
ncbi:ketopantoate reductase family protein [Treponema zioleckii]|uniref:ketopantoate reductase family protein n=1 Tax=Treponema zioleckii TaxID=331680 RepID=UPI00168BA38A|nr:ketopantoate reductase family protein [Treponema zioleckii]